jgi:hypothetical protein
MSNIFLNSKIKKLLDFTETESIQNNIKIINEDSSELQFENNYLQNGGNNFSDTSSVIDFNNENFSNTSSVNNQLGGGNELSATSSAFNLNNNNVYSNTSSTLRNYTNLNNKVGGKNIDKTNDNNNRDIEKLMSMLTSDSNSETSTDKLENKLKSQLKNFKGGTVKEITNLSNKENLEQVKKYFVQLKNTGVDVKLNNMSVDKFFGAIQNTTTEMSENTDNIINKIENLINSETSDDNLVGGAKKEKKEKNVKLKRVPSEGFIAFNELKKHIMKKLNITSPIEGAKKASEVKKYVSELNKDISNDSIKLSKESIKYFDNNMEKFRN